MAKGKQKATNTDNQGKKDPYIEGLKKKGRWDVISKRAKGGHLGAIKALAEHGNVVVLKQDDKKKK